MKDNRSHCNVSCLFQHKLYTAPPSHAQRLYTLIISHMEAQYSQGYNTSTAATMRKAVSASVHHREMQELTNRGGGGGGGGEGEGGLKASHFGKSIFKCFYNGFVPFRDVFFLSVAAALI